MLSTISSPFMRCLAPSVPTFGVSTFCPQKQHVWLDPYLQLRANKQNSLHADNVHFIRKPEESNTSPVGGWFVKWLPTELQASPGWREAKTERGLWDEDLLLVWLNCNRIASWCQGHPLIQTQMSYSHCGRQCRNKRITTVFRREMATCGESRMPCRDTLRWEYRALTLVHNRTAENKREIQPRVLE